MLSGIVGTTVAIDSRYAKSAEVKEQFCQARKQQLRDRLFELDLEDPGNARNRAMRDYLERQLTDGC